MIAEEFFSSFASYLSPFVCDPFVCDPFVCDVISHSFISLLVVNKLTPSLASRYHTIINAGENTSVGEERRNRLVKLSFALAVDDANDEESGDEESGDEESGDEESGDEESGDEESGDEGRAIFILLLNIFLLL